jgi:hypothetical protein
MPYIENLYNVTVGYIKRKYTKCTNSRYLCILVEIPL